MVADACAERVTARRPAGLAECAPRPRAVLDTGPAPTPYQHHRRGEDHDPPHEQPDHLRRVTVARSIIADLRKRDRPVGSTSAGQSSSQERTCVHGESRLMPGPGTPQFLILHRTVTVRDSSVTYWARRAARRLVCCPQQAARLDGRRARVGCRALRMASAGLSGRDFRLVVVGHGYARLLRVTYRYWVESRPSRWLFPRASRRQAERFVSAG